MRIVIEKGDTEEKVMLAKAMLANEIVRVIERETYIEKQEDNDEVLKPGIFNSRIFDTNDKLKGLRSAIACSIDMGEYQPEFGNPNERTIDPTVHIEWYYVMRAIEESGVARKFTMPEFIEQMIAWYPWLFISDNLQGVKRKLSKLISREKNLWTYGPARDVTNLKDMWAKYRQLGMDQAKVERMYVAAYKGLYRKLMELKEEQV